MKGQYLITASHEELLAIVNGLAGRQMLIRDIASVISPTGDKKKEKELVKLHQALAESLPPDVWDGKKKAPPPSTTGL